MSAEWDRHNKAIARAWSRYLAKASRYNFGVRESFVAAFREEWKRGVK